MELRTSKIVAFLGSLNETEKNFLEKHLQIVNNWNNKIKEIGLSLEEFGAGLWPDAGPEHQLAYAVELLGGGKELSLSDIMWVDSFISSKFDEYNKRMEEESKKRHELLAANMGQVEDTLAELKKHRPEVFDDSSDESIHATGEDTLEIEKKNWVQPMDFVSGVIVEDDEEEDIPDDGDMPTEEGPQGQEESLPESNEPSGLNKNWREAAFGEEDQLAKLIDEEDNSIEPEDNDYDEGDEEEVVNQRDASSTSNAEQ